MDIGPGHNFQSIEVIYFKFHPQISLQGGVQCTRSVTLFHLLYIHKRRSGVEL